MKATWCTLTLAPISDPERNRLREIYADKTTYELKKLIAVDRLFVSGGYKDDYADEFTYYDGVRSTACPS